MDACMIPLMDACMIKMQRDIEEPDDRSTIVHVDRISLRGTS